MNIELKPNHKFNGGAAATLCLKCSDLICNRLTEDLFCIKCLKSNFIQIKQIIDVREYKKSKHPMTPKQKFKEIQRLKAIINRYLEFRVCGNLKQKTKKKV